jgi:hypothetical protein
MALTTMTEEQDSSDRDSDDEASSEYTRSDEVHEKEEEQLAARETKAVNAGKVLVFGVLLLSAVLMGWLTYWFTSEEEQDTFETSVGCHLLFFLSRIDLHRKTNTSASAMFLTTTVQDLCWRDC